MKRLIFVLLVIGFAILKAQEQNFELKKINFQGNKTLSARELHSILVSKESPSKFWQILYKVNKRLGDKPQYLEKIKVANDIISLRNYYLDNGFFDVKIDTLIYYNYESKEAILNFLVDEGRPYLIDKIDFTGLEQIPDSLRRICMNFSFLKVGKRYRRVDVEAEIQRILNLLYDNGYQNAYVERVGIRVLVDSTKKIVSVFVPFNPNERYLIKDIKILVEGTGKMKVSEELVRREIEFKEGEFYSRSLILKSEANLSQTGLFENVRINLEPTGKADTVHLADVNVWVVPRNKHDIFPSIYFSDERNAFNVGVSVDYQNRNFLGGGRNFSSSVRFQIQSLSFNRMPSLEDTTSAGLIETNMRLNQPYLVGRRIPGEFSLALMIDKQKSYSLNIARNRVRFIYKPNGEYSGFLDWDIESVNIKFRGTVDPKLEKLYQRQLNSILSITFQIDRTDDLIYPRSGYAHMISVEEGGVVPFLLGQMGINVLPFSQYYKFGWLYRRFFGLNNSVFAFKFKLGVANEFYIKSSKRFELQPIPINRRFFAGGSASVRGWRVRELGNVSNPALGGNVLIEANFENRIIFWRSFGGVVFVDLGNLWDDLRYVKLNQFAVAGGFGLRYLTFFGGFRFDFGFKVYDPSSTSKMIFKKTAGQILKEMVFHIGVGQTF
ncbi:Beta-barrel assembly machine subunit BamA [Candidatus Kryptonium thompsonii]|uniref:Beta-barrel assembly machine subunit BamA n=1 Tax=Candidatus Kryptonium thompsonii TaxID=1633631 RepID=A0A0P1M4R5_9BACT|nr:BamA/TamA family outer membrane protein [Candidatus Kryptonium thompsoni]CUS78511.1 Beta-barrel assembly machine subunit BamA [Candidatus Kryptonium thompsoni]CUS81125.1 Beta-barrel assembly machine subunit BamA [Candidatus Kryptonium thompsoni]CUS81374.1 Beta-barrel assembly machine subunit BamA [Candidatus Kryptonium thompsoni]CUS82221.1 Beta-barrel assembly machine subunit BamA [Candidatus Kryptonium thompsoni]CUS88642.1 Beta-barrel assembly machine subunit BamA [Candidatus Kryptonium th